jgi:hypothetical protein
VRPAVPDVPAAGQTAGDDKEAAVVKGGAGSRVRLVCAGLLHGPGAWWPHEEASSGPG